MLLMKGKMHLKSAAVQPSLTYSIMLISNLESGQLLRLYPLWLYIQDEDNYLHPELEPGVYYNFAVSVTCYFPPG